MHIMIDLETMGTRPNAPIVSIGAVAFEPHRQHKDGNIEEGGIHGEFIANIDLESAVASGAVIDPSTVKWWLQQSEAARLALLKNTQPINEALLQYSDWEYQWGVEGVWGNGANFDNVILSETYRRLGLTPPWPFWADRCYRTVKNLYPHVEIDRTGVHHNALDDARSQALHLIEIDREAGGIL